MPMKPKPSAKNVTGDSGNFTSFMRRLMAVPHSEIKDKLNAEREKRTPKSRVSPASAAAPKRAI